jgi:hypothetical protein
MLKSNAQKQINNGMSAAFSIGFIRFSSGGDGGAPDTNFLVLSSRFDIAAKGGRRAGS